MERRNATLEDEDSEKRKRVEENRSLLILFCLSLSRSFYGTAVLHLHVALVMLESASIGRH